MLKHPSQNYKVLKNYNYMWVVHQYYMVKWMSSCWWLKHPSFSHVADFPHPPIGIHWSFLNGAGRIHGQDLVPQQGLLWVIYGHLYMVIYGHLVPCMLRSFNPSWTSWTFVLFSPLGCTFALAVLITTCQPLHRWCQKCMVHWYSLPQLNNLRSLWVFHVNSEWNKPWLFIEGQQS